jgi:hypothetical protein
MTKIIHLFFKHPVLLFKCIIFVLFIVSVMQVEAQQVVLMVDSGVGPQVDPAHLAKGAGLC